MIAEMIADILVAIVGSFNRLPKWVRACFWAFVLTVVLIGGGLIAIGLLIWIISNFGGLPLVIGVFVAIIFLAALSVVWNDIDGDKRKNDEVGK